MILRQNLRHFSRGARHSDRDWFNSRSGQQKLGTVAFLVIAPLSPFIYGVMGFVAGAVGALLYNRVASVIGAIEMELETMATVHLAPPSPASLGVLS